jgi:tetratricopeptide (TPR) repeat protein
MAGSAPAASRAPRPVRHAGEEERRRYSAVHAALDAGDAFGARAHLDELAARDGETDRNTFRLAQARVFLLEGDVIGAMRLIEEARAVAPSDPRPAAAGAELYAALGRVVAAEDELTRAEEAGFGGTPPLDRATGIVLLSTPGRQAEALALLTRAHRRDPDLPHLLPALAMAHVETGRALLEQQEVNGALVHAAAAQDLVPGAPRARALEADALAAMGETDAALEVWEELHAESPEAVAPDLARALDDAALMDLLAGERDRALERWARARRLGLPADQMKTGTYQLEAAAARVRGEGEVLFLREDWAAAEERFLEALRLDPTDLLARHLLGVVRFEQGDALAAAAAWERVLEQSAAEGVSLPDPVHLLLARAWGIAGDMKRARDVLEEYLAAEPEGEWAEESRKLLAGLPAPDAAAE